MNEITRKNSIRGTVSSVNVGRPQELPWKGAFVRTAFRKSAVIGPVAIRGHNLEGDGQADREVHGGRDMCIYTYPAEHYPFWESWLSSGPLPPGALGENLTLQGIDEESVAIGDRFRIGTAELIVTEPRQPCYKIDVSLEREGAAAEMIRNGRVGFYLGLVYPGVIQAGDPVEFLDGPSDNRITPKKLHRLNTKATVEDLELMASLSQSPHLSPEWQKKLSIKAAALQRRAQRKQAAKSAWVGARSFTIKSRTEETADVVSLWLEPADKSLALAAPLGGQFVTLELPASAEVSEEAPIIRSYSISATDPQRWRITVRRSATSAGGSQRVWELQPGERLGVRAPAGEFTLQTHRQGEPIVLISGGIGITPMLEMARDWVAKGCPGQLIAVHCIRSSTDSALISELDRVLSPHSNGHLAVFVSDGTKPAGLTRGLAYAGRVDRNRLAMLLGSTATNGHAYLCGSLSLVDHLKEILPQIGLPAERIHTEVFAAPSSAEADVIVPPGGIEVSFAQQSATVLWSDASVSLLDLAEDAGVDIAASCRQAVCGTCITPVLSGTITHVRAPAIPVPEGFCLPCVAVPTSRLSVDA